MEGRNHLAHHDRTAARHNVTSKGPPAGTAARRPVPSRLTRPTMMHHDRIMVGLALFLVRCAPPVAESKPPPTPTSLRPTLGPRWRGTTAPNGSPKLEERRGTLCAQEGQRLRNEAVKKARAALLRSVRTHAPQGSGEAFTGAELAEFNATAVVPFCPYGTQTCPDRA